jgi:tetratricopeptide (TPR) repeat protein
MVKCSWEDMSLLDCEGSMTTGLSLKLLAGIAMVLTATLSTRAFAVEQPHNPIVISNIQEPEEMRVASFPIRNTVPTAANRALEEKIQAGQAKMRALSTYEAITDFTDAINIEGQELLKSEAYEGRADAYMQTYEWDLAIKDLTAAISLEIGSSVVVGNVSQFRAIYPEYAAASDEAIAQKLNQTFYPDMKYEDFSQRFLTGHSLFSTTISELYIKRSDSYLKKGDWRSALVDFHRATNGFPDYAAGLDRWRQFEETYNAYSYVDMKNFDDANDGSVKLSIKQAHGVKEAPGPYELYRFELNCSAEKIRTLSWAEYDASGTLKKSGEGGRWGSIWPNTLGEILEHGACSNSSKSG